LDALAGLLGDDVQSLGHRVERQATSRRWIWSPRRTPTLGHSDLAEDTEAAAAGWRRQLGREGGEALDDARRGSGAWWERRGGGADEGVTAPCSLPRSSEPRVAVPALAWTTTRSGSDVVKLMGKRRGGAAARVVESTGREEAW
jgi:hypothetical protein